VQALIPGDRSLEYPVAFALSYNQQFSVKEPFIVLDQGSEFPRGFICGGLEPALHISYARAKNCADYKVISS